MWQTFSRSSHTNLDFADMTLELFQDTLRVMVFAVGIIYFIGHMVFVLFDPQLLDWRTLITTCCIALTTFLSLRLLNKHLIIAVTVWIAGLAGSTTFIIILFQRPEFAIFYTLLTLMAVIVAGWPAGILTEAGIAILIISLSHNPILPGISLYFEASIIIGGIVTGIIGWVSNNSLITIINWSGQGYEQARKNMEEARQHRGQLTKALKDLDMAYYRLERASAALTAAWREAEEAKRSKTELMTYVSHEIRTPLNLILGFSDMMLTSPESYGTPQIPGPYRGDLNKIYQNAHHLLALVNDVIDLDRAGAGKISITREEVDFVMLLTETVDMLRDYITTKGLVLEVNFSPDLPHLWIDRLRIRQVLLNLLVNAARFTEHGGIRVEAVQEGMEIIVRIIDTGRGIDKQELPHIFDEYHSIESTPSAWHGSSGLGLPISKKLIELHSGRIGVESIALRGTTFWFSLPCDLRRETQSPPWQFTGKQPYWLAPDERICVVIDNDPNSFALVQRHFQDIKVIRASDMAEGLALAEENKAIALIINLPGDLPSIASNLLVIRCPLPDNRQTAMKLGVSVLLQKPISAAELFWAIERIGKEIQQLLIVDDDPEIVQLYQRMLSTRYPPEACRGVYNGVEAMVSMNESKPDVVLLDLNMPEMDGDHLIKAMADNPGLSDINIIVITGMVQDIVPIQTNGEINISRQNGFTLAELTKASEVVIKALTPGWSPRVDAGSTARLTDPPV